MELEREIFERIAAAVKAGCQIEGVLFHGTAEPFDGPLKPGPDGLLWTAKSPVIAQQYIPRAGIETLVSVPLAYELRERVKPRQHDALYKIACLIAGDEITDVERDANGNLVSWAVPKGWPTYADVIRHIEDDLGYKAENDVYVISTQLGDGGDETYLPAGWKMSGRLYMTLAEGLILKDIRQGGEPDLTVKEHNNFGGFRKAEKEGYDGVIINDFAQTDLYGNFGHRSYGLNEAGLKKVEWVSIPASRYLLEDAHPMPITTPDVDQWLASVIDREPVSGAFGLR